MDAVSHSAPASFSPAPAHELSAATTSVRRSSSSGARSPLRREDDPAVGAPARSRARRSSWPGSSVRPARWRPRPRRAQPPPGTKWASCVRVSWARGLPRRRRSEDTDGGGPSADLLAVAEEARPVFARAGDELALAEAWFATAWAQLIRCRWAAMLEAVGHALEHARRAGSARWEGELPAWQGTAMFYGPTPVDEALRWYEEQQAQHPIALTQHAMLEAMRGNFDRARALAALGGRGRRGVRAEALARRRRHGPLGDRDARRRPVRRRARGPAELRAPGGARRGRVPLRGRRSAGRSLYALARLDEAARVDANRRGARAERRRRRPRCSGGRCAARILARRGQHAEAERVRPRGGRRSRGRRTCSTTTANALADLAEVYAAAGRAEDARAHLEQALASTSRRAISSRSARARRRLEELKDATSRLLRQSRALLGSRGAATRRRDNGQASDEHRETGSTRATRSRPRTSPRNTWT